MELWVGNTDYNQVIENVWPNSIVGTVIGFECPRTITLGKRSDTIDQEVRSSSKEFNVIRVDRGGHATLHNPGQLVVHPKVNLSKTQIGIKNFVRMLEESIIEVLAKYGIDSGTWGGEPGIYSKYGKIAYLGLRVRHGIVSHGVAINVCNNLEDFHFIRSCGQWNVQTASMQSLGVECTTEEVFNQFYSVLSGGFPLTPEAPATIVNPRFYRDLRV